MPTVYMTWERLDGRSSHAVGRGLLARLYTHHVGGSLPPVCTGSMGKPYFEDSPWHFSISHSKEHVFCVLAPCPVGLDAEEMDRDIPLAMAPKLLSPGELAQWEASNDPRETLLTFWVLKEAAAKLTGEGIRIHPRHTDFTLPDRRVRQIDGCLVAVICE